MLGILLMVPFFFICWRYSANTSVTKAADYYWLLCIFGMVAFMGGGIAFAAQIGFVAKGYALSSSRDAGKVVGYLWWVFPLSALLSWLFAMAVTSNTVWALIFAVLVIVIALVWGYLEPAAAAEAFMSEVGV